MPWINLKLLLRILRSRQIDPAGVSVYMNPRDAARLRHTLRVSVGSDLEDPESDDNESADDNDDDNDDEEEEEEEEEEEA